MAPLRSILLAAAAAVALTGSSAGIAFAVEDVDCPDFTYQEQAQAVLAQDLDDPHLLDDDGDGVACESLPSIANRDDAPGVPADKGDEGGDESQVAAKPRGGVDTGGWPST